MIELIFAGRALTRYLMHSLDDQTECVCGTIYGTPEYAVNHKELCPVARFYAAVEAVRKAGQA